MKEKRMSSLQKQNPMQYFIGRQAITEAPAYWPSQQEPWQAL
jgi:hypothetical protein